MSTATCNPVNSQTGANGRFAPGNPGGPGNPFAQRMAANREAILDAVGPEKVKSLLISLWDRGMEGNIPAARLCLLYSVGRPLSQEPECAEADAAKPVSAERKESPFAPLDDGKDAKRIERGRKSMDEVVNGRRERKDDTLFAPLVNGAGGLPGVTNPDQMTVCTVL